MVDQGAETVAGDAEARFPERIGGYAILGVLGSGGMGTVLRARQVAMDRVVALKILPPELARNQAFVQRFVREARAAGRLRHPHIVQAHDVGVAEGYYYFAMELVEGESLAEVLRREGALPQDRALELLRQTCSALAAAHKAGIIHRDIKPSNLMLDAEGRVRVTDFGLAKRVEGDVAVTRTGQSLGTPLYMAPEVAAGDPADRRSDLYSLGAAFFHLLAGRPPFEGKTFSELVVKHATATPPALRDVAPQADPRLAAIIDRLLAKAPADRHASAQALLDDLDALGPLPAAAPAAGAVALPDATTATLSPGKRRERGFAARRLERQRRATQRFRLAVAMTIASAVLLAVLAAAYAAIRGRQEPEPKPVTPLPASRVVGPPVRPRTPTPPSTPVPAAADWIALFDGKSLAGWRVVEEFPSPWGGPGGAGRVEGGQILLEAGKPWAGVSCQRAVPLANYELEVEARRITGDSTLCGILFTLVDRRAMIDIGGFGGVGVVGLDNRNANNNETTRAKTFRNGQWYRIRQRLEGTRLRLWIDGELMFDLECAGHSFGLPTMFQPIHTLGLVASKARVAYRGIRVRRLRQP